MPEVKTVTTASVHASRAKATDQDVTAAAKENRSFIRNHFDVIAANWPALKTAKKENRDGNRYPPTMPQRVAVAILKRDITLLAK